MCVPVLWWISSLEGFAACRTSSSKVGPWPLCVSMQRTGGVVSTKPVTILDTQVPVCVAMSVPSDGRERTVVFVVIVDYLNLDLEPPEAAFPVLRVFEEIKFHKHTLHCRHQTYERVLCKYSMQQRKICSITKYAFYEMKPFLKC